VFDALHLYPLVTITKHGEGDHVHNRSRAPIMSRVAVAERGVTVGRLKLMDYGLAVFAALGFGFTLLGLGEQPYQDYYRHPCIRAVNLMAMSLDLVILQVVAFWHRARLQKRSAILLLALLALTGAVLPWFELWYGSTFYYGEVRDKQGLPFLVNNGGALGSFVFLTYLLWRLPSGRLPIIPVYCTRAALTVLLFLAHSLVLKMVQEPWNLLQS
jgi:hypothetical protein